MLKGERIRKKILATISYIISRKRKSIVRCGYLPKIWKLSLIKSERSLKTLRRHHSVKFIVILNICSWQPEQVMCRWHQNLSKRASMTVLTTFHSVHYLSSFIQKGHHSSKKELFSSLWDYQLYSFQERCSFLNKIWNFLSFSPKIMASGWI